MKKKLVAAFLIGSMLIAQPVWADRESDHLNTTIVKVKEKIDIPVQYEQFEYYADQNKYSLTWTDEDGDAGKGSIQVNCMSDGTILEYQQYNGKNEDQDQKAKISYQQAQQLAMAFIKKTAPEYAGKLKLLGEPGYGTSARYNFVYNLYQSGIKVFDQQVSVQIDKKTGKILYFKGIPYDQAASFKGSQPVLSVEAVQKAYLAKAGMPLTYMTFYDYEKKESRAYLAYKLQNGKLGAINAVTGEEAKAYQDLETWYAGSDAAKNEAADSAETIDTGALLTPSEQEAVEETASFLSGEKLKAQLQQYFPALKTMEIQSTHTYKKGKQYIRSIQCQKTSGKSESASFRCNAVTGELYSYYHSRQNDDGLPVHAMTKKEAEELIHKLSPDKAKKVMDDEGKKQSQNNESDQYFQFVRCQDKIPVENQGISIRFNKKSGQVERYDVYFDDQLKLPSATGVLAADQVIKNLTFELCYLQTAQNDYQLVYMPLKDNFNLDAFTGKKIDAKGKEVTEENKALYNDISGRADEQIITQLYYMGIYLKGSSLKPDQTITYKEMMELLNRAGLSGSDKLQPADEESDGENTPDHKLIREEGVKMIITRSEYDKIARIPEIYTCPYEDKDTDQNLKGYIAVAYGLGMLGKGKLFYPKKPLTRAQAMVMIYHYLEQNQ